VRTDKFSTLSAAAHSGRLIDSPNESDSSQERAYIDIETFLASF
jgi:hypothetical protein